MNNIDLGDILFEARATQVVSSVLPEADLRNALNLFKSALANFGVNTMTITDIRTRDGKGYRILITDPQSVSFDILHIPEFSHIVKVENLLNRIQ